MLISSSERTSTEVLDFTAEIPTEDTSNSSANASSKEATVQKVKVLIHFFVSTIRSTTFGIGS